MKMTKAQARKRLKEAIAKVSNTAAAGHISFGVADGIVKTLNKQITRLN